MRSHVDEENSDDSPMLDQWIERARNGCETSFTELFRLYYQRIRRFAFGIVLEAQTADDVAQETFVRVVRKMADLHSAAAFEPWLYQIARNVARDFVRKERAHRRKVGHFAEQGGGGESAWGDKRDASDAALHALGKLSAAQREAVVLVYLEDYTHAEAATRLGCAESTISWRIFRARALLRKQLGAVRDR